MNQERLEFLANQAAYQKQVKNEWNKSRYGSVDGGFFDGFGKSHR
jgi:hypothetical protein